MFLWIWKVLKFYSGIRDLEKRRVSFGFRFPNKGGRRYQFKNFEWPIRHTFLCWHIFDPLPLNLTPIFTCDLKVGPFRSRYIVNIFHVSYFLHILRWIYVEVEYILLPYCLWKHRPFKGLRVFSYTFFVAEGHCVRGCISFSWDILNFTHVHLTQ